MSPFAPGFSFFPFLIISLAWVLPAPFTSPASSLGISAFPYLFFSELSFGSLSEGLFAFLRSSFSGGCPFFCRFHPLIPPPLLCPVDEMSSLPF